MNAADVLKYGHLTVLGTIDGLPDTAWDLPGVCGVWSTKDIIAHLASFEHILEEVLSSMVEDGPTPTLDRYLASETEFNDAEVARRKDWNGAEVLAEYNDTYAHVAALIQRIPADTLRQPATLPWYGAEYAIDDFITYAFYGHKREHCAQIVVFRDRPSR